MEMRLGAAGRIGCELPDLRASPWQIAGGLAAFYRNACGRRTWRRASYTDLADLLEATGMVSFEQGRLKGLLRRRALLERASRVMLAGAQVSGGQYYGYTAYIGDRGGNRVRNIKSGVHATR